jgi:hypothetical protein
MTSEPKMQKQLGHMTYFDRPHVVREGSRSESGLGKRGMCPLAARPAATGTSAGDGTLPAAATAAARAVP